jgi:phage FluMu protein Com
MGISRFRCPECDAVLKLARALEPGKRIKCPKCAAVVTVPDQEEEEPRPEPAPAAIRKPAARKAAPPVPKEDSDAPAPPRKQAARKAAPREDDDEAGEPDQQERPRRRSKASKKPAMSPVLLWSLIGGGGAVVVLAVVLVIVLSGGGGGTRGAPKGGGLPKGGGPPKGNEGPRLAEQILGKWQATPDTRTYRSVEYRKDGTVTLETERIRFDGTYEVLNANTVKLTLTKMDPPVPKSVQPLPRIEQQEVYIDGDTLELGGAAQAKFTRVKGSPEPGPAPGDQGEMLVELSEATNRYDEVEVKGKHVPVINCKVKYRFIKGGPNPAMWYLCYVDMGKGGGILTKVMGSKLQPEGTLEGQLIVRNFAHLTPTFTYQLQQSPSEGGPFRTISNRLQRSFKIGG